MTAVLSHDDYPLRLFVRIPRPAVPSVGREPWDPIPAHVETLTLYRNADDEEHHIVYRQARRPDNGVEVWIKKDRAA